MRWIRSRVRQGEVLSGTWLNLGSSLAAEIAGAAGFDWVCIDLEHGAGNHSELLLQLQALDGTMAAPLVRVACNDATRIKRTLDLGAAGIIVPYVNTADEAKRAVAAMRYPPLGVRGVSKMNRAARFGTEFKEYFSKANEELLTVVQIETNNALHNVEQIADVEGVDVLFVGPLDLSVSLSVPQQFDDPVFTSALERVVAVCRSAGKAAGILSFGSDHVESLIRLGFSFIASGSDGAIVTVGMQELAKTLNRHKATSGR